MADTAKPLGRLFTLGEIVSDITLWLRKETQKELDPDFLKKLVNYAVIDVAEIISGAGSGDYSKDANISDEASSVSTTIVQDASYVDTTRTVTKSAHGLTSAGIGKRIALWYSTVKAAIVEIESIPSINTFVLSKALGGDIESGLNYSVFSAHSSPTVDLSQYNIAQVTKVFDSINKEVIEVGDKEFDNLYRFDTRKNKCYYNVRGQTLYLEKGSDVAAWGTISMSYNSYPQKTTEEDDQLDIRDMYVPLVILKAKNFAIEHLGEASPESLTNAIDQKSREVRENIQREKEIASQKNYGNKKQ